MLLLNLLKNHECNCFVEGWWVFFELCCVELFAVVETYLKWLIGLRRVSSSRVSSVKVACKNVFVDVGNKKGGRLGSNLSMNTLFECVDVCMWKR